MVKRIRDPDGTEWEQLELELGGLVQDLRPQCRDGKGYLCERTATKAIVAPDGDVVGYSCGSHADEIIHEYQAKVDEGWHTRILNPATGRPYK